MLQIKLFGAGQAAYFEQPLQNFPSQQPHQLLCYLLLNARYPVLRDQIASAFWADYSTSVSLKYLRNALWKLRQQFECVGADLDTYVLVTDNSVALRRTSPYWMDVDVFEAAVRPIQEIAVRDLDADQAALLAEAVGLYTGDLLEGNYNDWCLNERERLRLLFLSALSKLAAYYEYTGSWEKGLEYGTRILAMDSTRERVHLQVMRLYWMSGDRDAALAQYKRCAGILRDELGVLPMSATTTVYQQMAQNQYHPTAAPAAALSGKVNPAIPTETRLQAMAEKTLQRVNYLQSMLEETRAELRNIELMIHRELLDSESAHS